MAKKVKLLKGVKLNTTGMVRNQLICAALEGILGNESYFGKSPDEVAAFVLDHVEAVEKALDNEKAANRAKKQAEKEQKAKERAEKKEQKRIEKGFRKAASGFKQTESSYSGE